MKRIKCIIVDDEPLAISLMEGYVCKTSFLELIGKCANAFEALEMIENNTVDLVFLDIQMPDLNGLELSRLINKQTKVIFTTAYEQYAIEGFKVDAIDYLLKPFNYEEFLKASFKSKEWFNLSEGKVQEAEPHIYVKSEYKQVKINLSEIQYIEGLKDYVKIYIKNRLNPILTILSLKILEEKLANNNFMRVHRSFIVNLAHIESIERSQIIINNQRITVADQYRDAFNDYIAGKMIIK